MKKLGPHQVLNAYGELEVRATIIAAQPIQMRAGDVEALGNRITSASMVVNPSAELDEETLKGIAEVTGGRYFRAQNTAKLVEIYDIIDAMEPIEQDAETFRPTAALYYWPLTTAWLLFMFLLVCDWRGWGGD